MTAPPSANPAVEPFRDDSVSPAVRGFLHRPSESNGDGLVLTHGAGSNSNAPLLVALAETFAAEGFTVLRCDLPYRQARSFGSPGPGDAKKDQAGLKNAVAAVRKIAPGTAFLGGHSYGGRQSTMLCAEEPELVHGLLLTSYPLHPPGKPEQKRVQHFPKLQIPSLFVSGTRDTFGSIAELEGALRLIPARTKLMPVEGAGHDLGFTKKAARSGLPKEIWDVFREFFGS
jgi:predicted alpha/beta-hydrolase family hydrolase